MNEITVKPLEEMTEYQVQAHQLHARIMTNGQLAASSLVEFCKSLKQMRDEKLYIQLGYELFEEYAEQAVGIKQRQAYSYISTYEKLGSTVLQSNATLGITKLELLTQIKPVDRSDFLDNNNIDEMSTRELKKAVEELDGAHEQISMLEADNEKLKQQIAVVPDDREDLKAEIAALKEQLQTPPTDPADSTAIQKEVKKALKEAEKLSKQKISQLSKEKEIAIKSEREKVLKEANEKISKLIEEKQNTEVKLNDALKEAKINHADPELIEINFVFKDLQSTANKLATLVQNYSLKNAEQAIKLSEAIAKTLDTAKNTLLKK